jgi:hypothetical protein
LRADDGRREQATCDRERESRATHTL